MPYVSHGVLGYSISTPQNSFGPSLTCTISRTSRHATPHFGRSVPPLPVPYTLLINSAVCSLGALQQSWHRPERAPRDIGRILCPRVRSPLSHPCSFLALTVMHGYCTCCFRCVWVLLTAAGRNPNDPSKRTPRCGRSNHAVPCSVCAVYVLGMWSTFAVARPRARRSIRRGVFDFNMTFSRASVTPLLLSLYFPSLLQVYTRIWDGRGSAKRHQGCCGVSEADFVLHHAGP
jgi:hypothetical protein